MEKREKRIPGIGKMSVMQCGKILYEFLKFSLMWLLCWELK